MLTRTINYTDYNGNARSEDFLFNLSKPEAVRLDLSFKGGLKAQIEGLMAENDGGRIMELFERIIRGSYGVKSDDGRSFLKREEDVEAFMCSAAYETLFEELLTNETDAAAFFTAVVPQQVEN